MAGIADDSNGGAASLPPARPPALARKPRPAGRADPFAGSTQRGPSVLRPVGRGRLVGTAFMVDRIALGVVEGGGGFSGSGSRRAPSLYPSRFPSRQCVVEGPPPLCNRRLVARLPWPTFSGCRPLPAQLVARQWKRSGGCLGGRVPRREPRCSAPPSVLGRIRCAELDTG